MGKALHGTALEAPTSGPADQRPTEEKDQSRPGRTLGRSRTIPLGRAAKRKSCHRTVVLPLTLYNFCFFKFIFPPHRPFPMPAALELPGQKLVRLRFLFSPVLAHRDRRRAR